MAVTNWLNVSVIRSKNSLAWNCALEKTSAQKWTDLDTYGHSL